MTSSPDTLDLGPGDAIEDMSPIESRLGELLYVLRCFEVVAFLALLAIPVFAIGTILVTATLDVEPNYWVLPGMLIFLLACLPLLYALKRGQRWCLLLLGLLLTLGLPATLVEGLGSAEAKADLVLAIVLDLPLAFFAFRAASLPRRTRELLSPSKFRLFSARTLLQLVGVPSNFYLTPVAARICAYAFLSAFFVAIWYNALQRLGTGIAQASTMANPFRGPPSESLIAIAVVVALGSAIVAARLAAFFRKRAIRICRVSLSEALNRDPRPPILFLRSFAKDSVALSPPEPWLFSQTLGVGRDLESLDGLLIDEASPYGPVVALGAPGQKAPPFGAARAYANHDDWQNLVQELAESALAVVVCVDSTGGLTWELQLLIERGLLAKTLFLLPPRSDRQRMLEDLHATGVTVIADALSRSMSGRPGSQVISWHSRGPGNSHTVYSAREGGEAYLVAIRHFLRNAAQTEVRNAASLPRQVRDA